jgi:tetratricopeptide (TPR) repeat protein
MYRDSQKEKCKKKGEQWLEVPLYSDNIFLGDAARFKQQGLLAIKDKEYNKAWEFFHKQKDCYMKHADEHNLTAQQTSELDASVGENLANILRLEGKHADALVHIIYWISTSSKVTKTQDKKLIAYFNRAKLNGVEASQVEKFTETNPNFQQIKTKLSEWIK